MPGPLLTFAGPVVYLIYTKIVYFKGGGAGASHTGDRLRHAHRFLSGKERPPHGCGQHQRGDVRHAALFAHILGQLAGAGLVNSYKGIKGGYELARPADQITLKQVVDAVEGRAYAISRCLAPEGECNRGASGCCSFQEVWRQVTEGVNAKLASVTFADMVADDAKRAAERKN